MELNYFDLIVSIVILLLGLKGILNGFFKEVFGLIGIIGGIFVASRLGDSVGKFLSDLIFKFENESAIGFLGFLTTLAIFWFAMVLVGMAFKKLTSLSGLGIFDKLLGFFVGASKFFFIAAVIAHAAYNINAVKSLLDETTLKTSVLFPIMVETGSYIMKLDPVNISNDINNTTKSVVDNATKEIAKNAKKELKESMPEVAKEIQVSKEGEK